MVRARLMVGIFAMALLGVWGCGKGETPPVEVQPQSGVERAKAILNDYVQGAPMGSEAVAFDEIVEELRKTDPQKATILEKGFADLQRARGNHSAKASELPKQL